MGAQASPPPAAARQGRRPDRAVPPLGAPVLPRWILIWFAVSSALILWDVAFVLARPGAFLWAPYDRYVQIDLGYAHPDGFVRAQAIMSLLELALVALALAWRRRAAGVLLAIVASALTAAKTILIFLIEVVTGGAHVGHNATADLVLLYVAPNAVWIVVPILVSVVLGRALIASAEKEEAATLR